MLNTTQIVKLLWPGVKTVFWDYPNYDSQHSKIFAKFTSEKSVEIDVEMFPTGIAKTFNQGEMVPEDDMGQQTVTTYVHSYVGLGVSITRQAVKDNLYKDRFPNMVIMLKNSMFTAKEMKAASILSLGWDASQKIGDGQTLFSNLHPIRGGVISNTLISSGVNTTGNTMFPAYGPSGSYVGGQTQLAAVDLNETVLEAAVIGIRQFRNASNIPIAINPKALVVSCDNEFQAKRLVDSAFRTGIPKPAGQPVNDISAIKALSTFPDGVIVNQYITKPGFWMVLTDCQNGFKHFEREALETDMFTHPRTYSVTTQAIERYSFGVSNFRCAFAGYGS